MADHPYDHVNAPAYPPWAHHSSPQRDLRPRQVPLPVQNLSMTQGSPVLIDTYDQQFMAPPTSVPSEHILYDTQTQQMPLEYQPEHVPYATHSWDEPMFAQPTKATQELYDTTETNVVPQNGQLVAEEYPISVDMGQQAEIYAAPVFPAHHESEATSVPADHSAQYLNPRDPRLFTYRRVNVPPAPHQQLRGQDVYPYDWYSQPATSPLVQGSPHYLESQDIRLDPHLRLSAPPIHPSAESSSQPVRSKRKYPHHSTRALPMASPALPRSERIQIQSTPDSYKGLVYVHKGKSGTPEEVECTYWLPEDYPIRVPEKIRPKEPKITQDTIRRLRPTIIHSEFQASFCKGCRTRGICVHFTFLLGARGTPDGLICDRCRANAKEEPIEAHRVCPIHNRPTLSQFLSSLPEDILVTAKQKARAMEFMRRALACDWDDVPTARDTQVVGDLGQMLDDANNSIGTSGLNSSDVDEEDEDASPRPAKRLKVCKEQGDDIGVEIELHTVESSNTGEEEC